MRERTYESLQDYNDLAKAEAHVRRPFDAELVAEDVERATAYYANREHVSQDAEREVYGLQKQKQQLIERMHAQFQAIDDPEGTVEVPTDAWNVRQQGERFIAVQGGRQVDVSPGQLLTDGEWGVAYNLNDASIDRNVKKRYVLEDTKRDLRCLRDEQIIHVERERGTTHLRLRKTYETVHEDHERGREAMGQVAERMVRTYLEQLSWDHPDIGFAIEHADVQQDVENKIDFIIHRRPKADVAEHRRGVDVEAVESAKDLGIQFTTNPSPDVLAHKHEQVERAKRYAREVDDLVVVSLPLDRFVEAYNQWRGKRTPGGPVAMWDERTREEIFRGVMRGLVPPEEIEREWQAAQAA